MDKALIISSSVHADRDSSVHGIIQLTGTKYNPNRITIEKDNLAI
jgi:hypothetical protein